MKRIQLREDKVMSRTIEAITRHMALPSNGAFSSTTPAFTKFVPLENVTEKQFHKMFDTNVLGMILVTQEAVKRRRDRSRRNRNEN
jgi:NAD(P)-dependent dehydrogenase (short-subunit alcohol dehydrogenase family)